MMDRAATVAVATGRGLYLSSAAGERFLLLEGREPATAVAFNTAGKQKAKIREDQPRPTEQETGDEPAGSCGKTWCGGGARDFRAHARRDR
jgi:hypothetical protein